MTFIHSSCRPTAWQIPVLKTRQQTSPL
jgi:hypothetical protein